MGQAQAADPNTPLSDEYLQAHANDPEVVPYLTSEERRRLTKLKPQPQMVRSRTGQMYDPNAAPTPDVGRFAERALNAINPMTYVRMAQDAYNDPGAAAGAVLHWPLDLAGQVIGGDFSGAMGDMAGGYALGRIPTMVRGIPAAADFAVDALNPDAVGM